VEVGDEDLERSCMGCRSRTPWSWTRNPRGGQSDIVNVDYVELGRTGPKRPPPGASPSCSSGSGYNPYRFDEEIVGMKPARKKP